VNGGAPGTNGKPAADAATARVAAAEARIAELLGLRAANAEALERVEVQLKEATGDQEELDRLLLADAQGDADAATRLAQLDELRRQGDRLRSTRAAIDRSLKSADAELATAEAEVREAEQRERARGRLETAARVEAAVEGLVEALTDHFSICRLMYSQLNDPRGNFAGRRILAKDHTLDHLKGRLAALFPGEAWPRHGSGPGALVRVERAILGRWLPSAESDTPGDTPVEARTNDQAGDPTAAAEISRAGAPRGGRSAQQLDAADSTEGRTDLE
jgi:hypothetical protein